MKIPVVHLECLRIYEEKTETELEADVAEGAVVSSHALHSPPQSPQSPLDSMVIDSGPPATPSSRESDSAASFNCQVSTSYHIKMHITIVSGLLGEFCLSKARVRFMAISVSALALQLGLRTHPPRPPPG